MQIRPPLSALAYAVAIGCSGLLVACGGGGDSSTTSVVAPITPAVPGTVVTAAQMNVIDLNAVFNAAKDGDTITLPAGRYEILDPLQISGKNNITVQGAGNGYDPSKATILSFKAEGTQNGISASTTNFITFKNFAIEDASGNGLFVTGSNHVTIDTMRAEWTNDPVNTSAMAYGLYPVKCDNVVVTNSIVAGTRDAGVYVGQSTNIMVSFNDVHDNVAGVEIENSHNAIVEGNIVHNNTGGILVFALTSPTRFKDTTGVVVKNNTVVDNNVPPAANATGLVLTIPPGTGVMVLASQNTEVTGNTISNHKTTGVLVVSAQAAGLTWNPAALDDQGKSYDPYARGVYVHANNISNFGSSPGGAFNDPTGLQAFTTGFFAQLKGMGQPQNYPAVLWDGIVDSATLGTTGVAADGSGGAYANNFRVCSKGNNVTAPVGAAISYENMDLNLIALMIAGAGGTPLTAAPHFPSTAMDCTLSLPAITLP